MNKRAIHVGAMAVAFLGAALACESRAFAKGCTEVSDIVGYEKCHRYGDGWAVERRWPIGIALTLPYQTFDPNGLGFDFAQGKHDPNTFTASGDKFKSNALGAFGFNLRIEGFVWRWFYVGVEWGLGFGHNQIADFTNIVGNTTTQFSGSDAGINTVLFHGGGFLGLRIPLGRMSLRLEGFAGGNIATVNVDSALGGYEGSGGRGSLMPRAAIDVWASPNVTMSAFGGFNGLDTRERTVGVMLEYHVRSFDGAFAFW